MNFTIENASPQDREEIIKVLTIWNMHHIPSSEAKEIDTKYFFTAKVNGKIVGVAGYELLTEDTGKTRLLGVYPEFKGSGIGRALQETRLQAMYNAGILKVFTSSDRPGTIIWYKKYFHYREVGSKMKTIPFGSNEVDTWTILEMDLELYMKNIAIGEKQKNDYITLNEPNPLVPYAPLIINVALTGVIPTKRLTPYVPISVNEIIEDAIKVYDSGASIVHLHARNKLGEPVSDARYYEDIIIGIRKERPDMICCATTSGRAGQSFEERSEVLQLTGAGKPDMASLTLGSLNFLSGASVNSLETVQRLAMLMKEKDIKPEMEIFDAGMVNVAKYLERHNIIGGKKYFNILLGNLNTAAATINELSHIYASLPEDSIWAAAGLGNFQLPMNMAAMIAGGNIRIGLEDNIYYDSERKVLTTNVALVERICRISTELDRTIATPKITRALIGL